MARRRRRARNVLRHSRSVHATGADSLETIAMIHFVLGVATGVVLVGWIVVFTARLREFKKG